MPLIKTRTGRLVFYLLFFLVWIFFPQVTLADAPISGKWASGATGDNPGFIYSNAMWHLRNSKTTGAADISFGYGIAGDQPVSCDWDGDGIDTPGVFRNGTWYLRSSNTGGVATTTFAFGQAGDIAVCGDWNRDFRATIGVFRNGTWYLRNSNTNGVADIMFSFGQAGDIPVAGDWNGDWFDTIGIFRSGSWFLRNSNGGGPPNMTFSFGLGSDSPVVGDWDGNDSDTIGVVRGITWFLRNANSGGAPALTFDFPYTPPTPTFSPTPTSKPPITANFGLGLAPGSAATWFQSEGGDIHANGTITNGMPALPASQNYFSLPGSQPRPGLVSHGANTNPDLGTNNAAVSQQGWLINNQTYPVQHTYEYFVSKLTSIGQWPLPASANACDGSGAINEAKINAGGGFFYCNVNATVSTLNIPANATSTVFINGNLTIQPPVGTNQKIKVAKRGFLGFIVKGNITVQPNVGEATTPHTDPDLEGLYLSNGQFIAEKVSSGSDNQLVVKGTVIAWGGIDLKRSLFNNNNNPAHRFLYDPFLSRFAPNLLTNTPVHWQQLPP